MKDEYNYPDKNIGELADSALGDLTLPEEELDMSIAVGPNHEQDIKRAQHNLSEAQCKIAEIVRRYEATVGPIG